MRWSPLLVACLLALPAEAQDAASGERLFATFCATCHGLDATGTGPTAEIMAIQPADLTVLSAKNGGLFPTMRVIRRIDGRDPLLAHGSPMPLYGAFFEGAGAQELQTPDGPLTSSLPVLDIVAWLREIQR